MVTVFYSLPQMMLFFLLVIQYVCLDEREGYFRSEPSKMAVDPCELTVASEHSKESSVSSEDLNSEKKQMTPPLPARG